MASQNLRVDGIAVTVIHPNEVALHTSRNADGSGIRVLLEIAKNSRPVGNFYLKPSSDNSCVQISQGLSPATIIVDGLRLYPSVSASIHPETDVQITTGFGNVRVTRA